LELEPAGLDRVSYAAFAISELRLAGLDLDEHDAVYR
jgi:hypothetical protein